MASTADALPVSEPFARKSSLAPKSSARYGEYGLLLVPGGDGGPQRLQVHPQICAYLSALLDRENSSGEIKIVIRHGQFHYAEINSYVMAPSTCR